MDPNETTTVAEPSTTVTSPLTGTEPPTQPDTETEPDALAVEVERPSGKQSMVPVEALRDERGRFKKTRDERDSYKSQLDTLTQQMAAVEPILRLVQQNPALLAQIQGGQAPTRTEPTEDDLDAKDYAEAHGLYNTRGEPDLVQAKKALAIEDRRRERKLAPVQQASNQQKAEANFQRAVNAKDAKGRPYARPETIRAVFQQMPPHLAADPQVAQVLLNQARALDFDYLTETPQPAPNAPIFSEAPGGRSFEDGMSPEEQRVAKNLGASEKDWKAVINRKGGLWGPLEG